MYISVTLLTIDISSTIKSVTLRNLSRTSFLTSVDKEEYSHVLQVMQEFRE